ncbi:hypothetical protein [Chelativorans xinjiangense]|uniref:hypothetical protein n=1 Tax=Chelativorans xinjiangense TaxID=2681485 RepID=UPI00135ABE0A|nr:hypothetical protein [Chelativorans xinjiangense]
MFGSMIIGRIAGFVVVALVAMVFSAQLASAHGNEDHAAELRPQTADMGMEYRHLRPAEVCASTGDAPILKQSDPRFDSGRCFHTCASPAGLLHETIFSIVPSGRVPSGPVFTRLASQDTAPPRKPPRSGG